MNNEHVFRFYTLVPAGILVGLGAGEFLIPETLKLFLLTNFSTHVGQ
jgi:hypothetical protein